MKHSTIFLDIDGVLATEESATLPEHEQFAYPWDKECVAVFNEIIAATDADIVLTSDWRISFSPELDQLALLFKHNGVIKSPINITPDYGGKRGKEIASYVFKHNHTINSFLILDDIKLTIHSLHFVQFNINYGLKQQGIKEKCLSILQSDQSAITMCINCEQEYHATTDLYACSAQCRNDIDVMKQKDKHGLTDDQIRAYQLHNLVVI